MPILVYIEKNKFLRFLVGYLKVLIDSWAVYKEEFSEKIYNNLMTHRELKHGLSVTSHKLIILTVQSSFLISAPK